MESVDAFKAFVKTMPEAANAVHEGRYTWQQLYEMYALYGEDHEVWDVFKKKKTNDSAANLVDLNVLTQLVKNIDMNALVSGMQGLEKVLGIVATLFDKEEAPYEKNLQHLSRMDD